MGGESATSRTIFATVIVPIYNASAYLDECLTSLAKQDCSDYEVICIDDCSSDNSFEIAMAYAATYPNLFRVMRNEENIGQGQTRNRGTSLARGEYVTFVDSDDYVAGDYISTYRRAARQGDFDAIVAGYTRDVDGRLTECPAPQIPWCLSTYSIACAKLFRLAFLDEHSICFPKERRGEDIFFNLACFCGGASCERLDYTGYHYRLNRQSTTKTISHAIHFEKSVVSMFDQLNDEFPFTSLEPPKRDVVCYAYIANALNALITYAHGCGIKEMRSRRTLIFSTAKRLFPEYETNPLFHLSASTGQTLKIKWSVWFIMILRKIKIDILLFHFISII